MSSDEFFLDAEGTAYSADLVLEQHLQRLHDLEVHLLRKAAHIVVGLDLGGDARDACRLDNVRINGALGQPSGIFNGLGIFVEGLHEEPSDNLSLCLGLGYSGKFPEEVRGGVRPDYIEAHILI